MAAPLVATAIEIAKATIGKALLNKGIREINKRVVNEGIESEVKELEVVYEGVSKKKSAIWVALGVASITVAQSMGLIDSSVAQALLDLLNNEAFQDAVNSAVDNAQD